mmetsp:Transcript_13607/g.30192  ORF Transcript_13607/g.30192 Transcript_13607/m.30192 type:complete len:346 (-) Transcript_13607:71-1108(-)
MRCLAIFASGVAAGLPPHLQTVSDLNVNNQDQLVQEILASPLTKLVPTIGAPERVTATSIPTVVAHGMGDSCFNGGMKSITKGVANATTQYATCIPTGDNWLSDTINGFLLNMDKSVDVFAKKIQADPKLKGGFNAVGFSQGNSLIRGYIQKYNDPPVNAFLSVHGTVMGVAAFPSCFEQEKPLGLICKGLAEVLGDLAYNPLSQGVLFQADYYRDPALAESKGYLRWSQLAAWNNENPATVNSTHKENFGKTKRFAMVKALKDSMVYPNEAEWWGQMDDGAYGKALEMKDTKWYKEDLFGLKTADEAGRIHFETTPGDHLQFTDKELYGWVAQYFQDGEASVVV